MTCHELRLYFEDPLHMEAKFPREAEHLARCTECARFVEARRQFGAGLRLLRASAPQPSPALDAAVLANYRQPLANRPSAANSLSKRRAFATICWSAAAAVLALAAALALHSARKSDHSRATASHPHVSQPLQAENNAASINTVPSASITHLHPARRRQRVPSTTAAQTLAPRDFRSLMYCDPLSCGGAMQVIRVQLPSSAVPFRPAADSLDAPIYADVLVGPDGIARGIRVVQ
jgi:hypothetical protein